ncbi:MAG: PilN domain-containing protein [Glaciecola sp.]|jgi:type IV pilus assembly protein PilN
MASINLLPWRDAYKAEQKRLFLTVLVSIAVLSLGVVWTMTLGVQHLISVQQTRVAYLQQAITTLDLKLEKIMVIKTKRSALEQQMKLIEQLQISRNTTPIVIDALAQLLPDGIAFMRFSRSNNIMTIDGVSNSNNRLSAFMRALNESDIFSDEKIVSIAADPSSAQGVNHFRLTFNISSDIAPILSLANLTRESS